MNKLQKSLLPKIQAAFSRASIRGKKLNYEWQNQTDGPQKPFKKWLNEKEIQEVADKEFEKVTQQDFRRELFDLNPKSTKPKIESDEIYGKDSPILKPFDTINVQEMYTPSYYQGRNKMSDLKLIYLTEFNNYEQLFDSNILDLLTSLKTASNEFMISLGYQETDLINDSDWEGFFTTEAQLIQLQILKQLISKTNSKNLPNLILYLSRCVHYNRDYSADCLVFKEIENAMSPAVGLLTPIELAKTYYGLTGLFPKKGSLPFRMSLRDAVISKNPEFLSLSEVLHIYTAFRNDNNTHKVHEKCLAFLMQKFPAIENLSLKKNTLALEILYTFANSKPMKRYRKKFKLINGNEREDIFEQDRFEHLFMPLVLKNVNKYGHEDLIRLLSAFKILNYKNYDEVFFRVQNCVSESFEQMSYDSLAFLVHYAVKTNVHGFGTRNFWDQLTNKITTLRVKNESKCPSSFIKIVHALVFNRTITPELFTKHFTGELLKILKQPASLSLNDLSLIAMTIVYTDLTAKNKEPIKLLFKELIRAVTNKNEWIPLFYYQSFKYLLTYVSKKYPEWNLSHLENLSYHAEKAFSASRLQKHLMTQEYFDYSNIIQKQMDMNMMSFVDFENLFLIDYAQQDFRFAIFIRKTSDCLYYEPGETRIATPTFELKKELLALHDWTVCTVDDNEFHSLGENRVEWFKGQIQESYAKAHKQIKALTEERIQRSLKRMDVVAYSHLFEDSEYPEHERQIKSLRKEGELDGIAKEMNQLKK